MNAIEKVVKWALLYAFCFLNAMDLVQTVAFLRMGIEGNLFAVYYPQIWFLLKAVFTFGLPLGLYSLDIYLESKEDQGIFYFLKGFVPITYFIVFFADIFFLRIVLRNTSILGRILP